MKRLMIIFGMFIGMMIARPVDAFFGRKEIEKIKEQFEYKDSPHIDTIEPSAGAPCITAAINGRNLKGIGLVKFGWKTAQIIDSNDNKIIVEVPYPPSGGKRTVEVNVGFLATSNSVLFTFEEPVIDSISPSSGEVDTEVTIKGRHFGVKGPHPSLYVKFGKSLAKINSWTDKEIIAEAPSDYGTGENDRKMMLNLITYAYFGWKEMADAAIKKVLTDLLLSGVRIPPGESKIEVDVKVVTPVGESNAQMFTYRLADKTLPTLVMDKSKVLFIGGVVGTFFYAMNADGSGKTEVLPKIFSKYKGDGCLYHISVSTNGRKIAIPIYPAIRNRFAEGIAIIEVDKDQQINLYNYPPVPSLDRKSLAMVMNRPGGVNMKYLRWSPDGERIAFEGVTGSGSSIYVINVDASKSINRLTYCSGHFPTWMPDGKKIIFEGFLDIGSLRYPEPPEIYLINADGKGKKELITGSIIIGKPECSLNGKKVAFCGPSDELYVGALKGNGITNIRKLTEGCKAYYKRWSPDGTKIVFSDGDKIYVINADGTGLKEIYQGHNWLVAWVPDFPLE